MLKIVWERWKKVPELEEIKVSNLGNIKINGKLVRPKVNREGYFVLPYKHKILLIHRLVAKAFLKHNLQKYDTIDHLDGNKRNNTLSNLEIVSQEENLARAKANLYEKTGKISLADVQNFPVWKIRLSDGKNEFSSLEKACNHLMSFTDYTREEATQDILGTLLFGLKGKREWTIVKEKKNGQKNKIQANS